MSVLRALVMVGVCFSVLGCGDDAPRSIQDLHHEVSAVVQTDGRLSIDLTIRSGAVDQSYWLPHVAGVVRLVMAGTNKHWPDRLKQGAAFNIRLTGDSTAPQAMALYVDAIASKTVKWASTTDYTALDALQLGDSFPAGNRAIRAFCDDATQAPRSPNFCLKALAKGR